MRDAWRVHSQPYTTRTLCKARILPRRRRNAWASLVWLALAIVVPGGFAIGLITWLLRRLK